MKNVFFTFLMLSALGAKAQKDTIWFDDKWKVTIKADAAFFRPPVVKKGENFYIADYYSNGTLQMEGLSRDASPEFWLETVRYYDLDGTLTSEIPYVNNVREGIAKEYYPTGKIKAQYTIKNNKQEGIHNEYFENGELLGTTNYKNDKLDGKYIQYFSNGKVKVSREFSEDLQIGTESVYYENGQLSYTGKIVNNVPHGLFTAYYDDGKLMTKGMYVNGEQTNWKNYDGNGKVLPEGTMIKTASVSKETASKKIILELVSEKDGISILSGIFPKSKFYSESTDFNNLKITLFITADLDYLRNTYKSYQPKGNEILVLAEKISEEVILAGAFSFKIGKSLKRAFINKSLDLSRVNSFLIKVIEQETTANVALWSYARLEKEIVKE